MGCLSAISIRQSDNPRQSHVGGRPYPGDVYPPDPILTDHLSSGLRPRLSWNEAISETAQLSDALGRRVDELIAPVVAALRAHGIPTTASCQGHLKWGLPFPWVEVCAQLPQLPPEDAEESLRKQNLALRALLLTHLAEFYSQRASVPFDTILCLRPYVMRQFRIQSTGAETLTLAPPHWRQAKLTEYRAEMTSFGQFLRTR